MAKPAKWKTITILSVGTLAYAGAMVPMLFLDTDVRGVGYVVLNLAFLIFAGICVYAPD